MVPWEGVVKLVMSIAGIIATLTISTDQQGKDYYYFCVNIVSISL